MASRRSFLKRIAGGGAGLAAAVALPRLPESAPEPAVAPHVGDYSRGAIAAAHSRKSQVWTTYTTGYTFWMDGESGAFYKTTLDGGNTWSPATPI